jgi:hypothetical protein
VKELVQRSIQRNRAAAAMARLWLDQLDRFAGSNSGSD